VSAPHSRCFSVPAARLERCALLGCWTSLALRPRRARSRPRARPRSPHGLGVFALSALRYRAGRAADAALARVRAAAPGWDESARWLASVWAKGAWEGGCVAECAKALQLARGLDVSAARERRRLAGPAALAADVEEEASLGALHGNQLCCAIVLGVRCSEGGPNDGSAHRPVPDSGAWPRGGGGGGGLGDGGGGRSSAGWGVARLTLKKQLFELGRLVQAHAERTAALRCSDVLAMGQSLPADGARARESSPLSSPAWGQADLALVHPLLEVVLEQCCDYCSACLLVGLSTGSSAAKRANVGGTALGNAAGDASGTGHAAGKHSEKSHLNFALYSKYTRALTFRISPQLALPLSRVQRPLLSNVLYTASFV
jgi:hypothetical protein